MNLSQNRTSDLKQQIKQLKSQNDLLKKQLMSSSLIHELTKVLHSCTDLESIIKTILLAIQEIIEFDRVILFKIDQKNFRLKPDAFVGFAAMDISHLSIPLGFEGGEITDALFLNRHILVEEPDKDDLFSKELSSPSYLVIPLINKVNRKCWEVKNCSLATCPAHESFNPYCWSIPGSSQMNTSLNENDHRSSCISCQSFKVEGVVWMDRYQRQEPITSDDITVLTAVINLAGIIIENFRIFKTLDETNVMLQQANKQLKIVNSDLEIAQTKINNDLDHAQSIQQGLLPQDLNKISKFNIGARYLSADAVGGDYYDVFQISPDIFGIVVADVSGHGIASALIMSMAKILLKTYANNYSPAKTLEQINKTFLSEIKTGNFVTVFYALLYTKTHQFRYTSAGHCPVIIFERHTGKYRLLKADGLFLGVFQDLMLNESVLEYEPDKTRLVLYTDGLTESKNENDELYGVERLVKMISESASVNPSDAVELILSDQNKFCNNCEPADDITLLIIDL
ncbi:MAG TPA: SpoIIE family protein phosphatase [Chitinispirillaceae bacterium]|nr:SpoIIE family protein phosphatase [Chitinispirillaceae bacterium]